MADLGVAFAVLQAEHLHEKLDVDDAALAALEVALAAGGLDALAHRADRVDELRLPGDLVRLAGDRLEDVVRELGVAGDDPGPRQRLAFPELAVALVVVADELVERDDQAARLARRPQPHVDLVEPALRSH